MKYDLEELLSKSYEQGEKASREFSRSVIEKMQASTGRGIRKRPWICAAACMGVLLLSGAALLSWKAHSDVGEGKQSAWRSRSKVEEKVAQVPDADGKQSEMAGQPGDAFDGGDRVAKNPSAEGGDGGEGQKGSPASTGVPPISDESSNASDRNASEDHSRKERSQSANASYKSVEIQPEPGVRKQSVPSDHQVKKPAADEGKKPGTAEKPGDAGKPGTAEKPGDAEKPGTASKPAATGKPAGSGKPVVVKDYTRLCSMQCVRPEGEDVEEVSLAFSSLINRGVLKNQVIASYDQLQEIIRIIKKEHFFQHVVQGLVEPLKKYDRSYFQKNVLYLYNIYETMGYDFTLFSVKYVEEEGGRKKLKIELDGFWALPPDQCAPCVMCYYGSFIQMPRELAEKCDDIECSGGYEE